jgi:imidazolonepropionase-like amidohydrolase
MHTSTKRQKDCLQQIFLLVTLLSFNFHSVVAQKTAILCKTLIDGTGKVISNPYILVEGDKIISIGQQNNLPKGITIIDLKDFTILPGMIDAHTHPLIAPDNYQLEHLRGSSASKALDGLKRVQDLLLAGWTTLRVAGDADVGYAHLEIRNAINKGLFIGPRIYGAGHYISVTGGGGDINFLSYEQPVIADGLIADGPDELQKAIRTEIKNGSDWIKLLVTGAFMSVGDNPQNVHFSVEELKVAVEEAARRGVPVMAHAHATEGIKQAVKAGVRSVEHGSYIDEEAMDLMIKHGTYLIPTLTIGLYFEEMISESKSLTKAIELSKKSRAGVYESMKLAVKKGVKIGVGSDYVGFPPEFSAREFNELATLGMTPMQAIQAGTKVNAELLNKDKEIGTVEVGKMADLIAVKGDPLKDLSELQRVKFVMIGGKIAKNVKD